MRAYDTKAQIVGVGYIFALGIVFRFGESVPADYNQGILYVLAVWAIIILPILLFGFVIYPTRKTAPGADQSSGVGAKRALYVDPAQHKDAASLLKQIEGADPSAEIAHELLVVSGLREMKRRRFLRALFSAGLCFTVIFLAHLVRSIGAGS